MKTNSAKFVCVSEYNTKEMRDAKSAFANTVGGRCGVFAVIRTFTKEARGMFEPFLNKYGYDWEALCNKDGELKKKEFNSAMLDLLKNLAPQMYKEVQDENAEEGLTRTAIVDWKRKATGEEYTRTRKNGDVITEAVKVWDDTSVFNESRWTVNKLYKVLQYSETFKANGCLGSMEVNTIEAESAPAPAPEATAAPAPKKSGRKNGKKNAA